MTTGIILMGPDGVGKSTVGTLLSEALGLPFYALRADNQKYYTEHGFDPNEAQRVADEGGFEAAFLYFKPFEAYALSRSLDDHPNSVLALGGWQADYEDDALFEQVRELLRPYRSVVLLLPSPDVDESVRILKAREQVFVDGMEITEHFVKHHSNHDLAKLTIYTKGRTPGETCEEILSRVDPSTLPIILIGPMGTGKSTVGKLVARRLELPQVSLDKIRWDYYKEIGFDEARQGEIGAAEGFAGVYSYWKPFEIHAVERALSEYSACIMDFGAGHSVFEDDAYFARAAKALEPHANVVLLLPSPDLDESAAILRERQTPTIAGVDLTRRLITHHSSHALAKLTVYTEGKTAEETRDEILQHYRASLPDTPAG